jgi:hypothetical protein
MSRGCSDWAEFWFRRADGELGCEGVAVLEGWSCAWGASVRCSGLRSWVRRRWLRDWGWYGRLREERGGASQPYQETGEDSNRALHEANSPVHSSDSADWAEEKGREVNSFSRLIELSAMFGSEVNGFHGVRQWILANACGDIFPSPPALRGRGQGEGKRLATR